FASYLSLGLGMLVVTQALINMGVSVTILPVTGQPLPFISMGGSSIMATGILIGMILSVTKSIEAEEVENIEIETENTDSDERQVESRD
ncbi:MAG: FtsW/RodA/SpoVE family cell cycle protein, partial [Bacteroidales bacterium]|nr:FtsW/RodA/SpoVE family cell cycle protein [Bacteroidales bacterium]